MARLRRKLAAVPGARLFLMPMQDIRVGGRQSNAAYQYTLQGDSTAELYEWAPKLLAALQHNPVLRDVNSDQQQKGLETDLRDRPRHRQPARASTPARSTTRCTTRSASARSRPSTARRTSITWSWRWRRATGRRPTTLKDIYVSTAGGVGQRHADDQRGDRHGHRRPATSGARQRGDRGQHRRAVRRATRRPTRWPIPARAAPRPAPRSAPARRRWCRWPPSRTTARATRRWRSTTRGCSSPPRSRSIWRPASRSSDATAAIDAGDARRSACRPASTAASRAPRRPSSSRSPASRC